MSFNLVDIWHEMPLPGRLVTITLIVMSVWSVGITVERSIHFFLARSRTKLFAGALARLLDEGRLQAALRLANETKCYLANLVSTGLQEYTRKDDRAQGERLHHTRNAFDRSHLRELEKLKRGQGVLGTIGSSAPFVGLLGTTLGIVGAFSAMAESGGGGLGAIAGAIGEALLNTALGLIVAIPAVMAFNYFTGRTENAVTDMTEATSELVDYLERRAPQGFAEEDEVEPAAEAAA